MVSAQSIPGVTTTINNNNNNNKQDSRTSITSPLTKVTDDFDSDLSDINIT
jgi:hypothetical protein